MDDVVLDMAIRLDEILDGTANVEPKVSPIVTRKMDTSKDLLDETGVIALKSNFKMGLKKKKTCNTWTPELKENFLNDVCMLSESELAEKYHLSVASVKQYISKMKGGKSIV